MISSPMRIKLILSKMCRKLVLGALLASPLTAGSAFAEAIPEPVIDCENKTCLIVEAQPDVFVESLSLLLPEVTSSMLSPNTEGLGGFLKSMIGGTVEIVANEVAGLLSMTGVEVRSTLFDVYFAKPDEYRPIVYQYGEGYLSPVSYFEQGLTVFLRLAGGIVSFLIFGTFLLRLMKLGMVVDGQKRVLKNLVQQLPLIIIVVICVIPVNGGLPVFSVVIVGCFLLGAFMASILSTALASYFALYLMDGIDTSSSDQIARAERLTGDMLRLAADDAASELSRNIFNLDYLFFSKAQSAVGGERPSRSTLVSKVENIDLDRCFQGKWHLFTNLQGCERMRDYIGDAFEAGGGGGYRVLDEDVNWGSGGAISNQMMLELLVSNMITDWAEREQSGILEDEAVARSLAVYAKEVVELAYKKFAARKELFCAQTTQIRESSIYRNYWTCNKLDTRTGEFSGVYAQEVGRAYAAGLSTDVNLALERVKRDNTKTRDEIPDSAIASLASSLVDYQFREEGLEVESEVLLLKGANVVSLVYEAVRVVSSVDVTYVQLLGGSEWLSGDVGTKIAHIVQPVEFSGDTRSLSPEHYLFSDKTYPFASERSDSDSVPNVKYDSVYRYNVSESDMDTGTNPSLFIYLEKYVRSSLVALTGLKVLLVGAGTFWEDNQTVAGSLGIALMIVNILLSISLFFFAFGFIAMLFAVISLVVASFVRLIVHLIFIPLYIASFVWEKSDEEEDDENVFFPEKLKKVLQRSLVDPLAISVSFLFSIVVISIYFELTARILISVAGEGVFSDNGNVLDFANGLLQMFLKAVFLPILAGWILFKGNSFVDYIYRKITQFITDDTGGEGDSGNELQDIRNLLTQLRGLSG